jgi:hypothetical protein
MKFMARLHRTNSTRSFQVLSIAAMILAIAPTAQAAPKMTQRLAMKDQPLCFVQLPGKTQNLDKLCGLGSKGGNTIDIDIDVNKDGISDQLLEATLQTQAFIDAETKRWQANARPDIDPLTDPAYKAYQAAATNANLQLQARLPYSNKVKQVLAALQRINEDTQSKYDNRTLNAKELRERETLDAKYLKISGSIQQDPSYLKVTAAHGKVYDEIYRRSKAK